MNSHELPVEIVFLLGFVCVILGLLLFGICRDAIRKELNDDLRGKSE